MRWDHAKISKTIFWIIPANSKWNGYFKSCIIYFLKCAVTAWLF